MKEPQLLDTVYVYSRQNWIFTEWRIVSISYMWDSIGKLEYIIEFLNRRDRFERGETQQIFSDTEGPYKAEYNESNARSTYERERRETLEADIDYIWDKLEELREKRMDYEDKLKEMEEELKTLSVNLL